MLALVVFSAHAEPVATVQVDIRNHQFVPAEVVIKVGGSVKWLNQEKRTSHSVLFQSENLESDRLMSGDSWEKSFNRTGEFPYVCGPHPEMKGLIRVTE